MGAHRLDGLKARRALAAVSIQDLAKRANITDEIIQNLEAGATCQPEVTQRILDALGPPVALATNTQASPTVFTVTAGHSFQTGDTVLIAGNTGSNADPNGTRVVTRVSATTFSVPIDCSTAGGSGGTAVAQPASLTLARLT